jgi:hypothetical protein
MIFSKNLAFGLYPSSSVLFKQYFGSWLCLSPGLTGGRGGTYSVTPFPPFLPEDGSRASFRNVVFKEKTLDDG